MNSLGAGLHPLILHGPLVWKVALAVLVLGVGGAAFLRRRTLRALGTGLLLGLALFGALFVGGGALAHRFSAARARDGSDDGDALSAITLAAATPFHRPAALHHLVDALDVRKRATPARRDRGAFVRLLLGDAKGAAQWLFRYHALDASAEVAEAAHEMALAGTARFHDARWQEASDDFEAAPDPPDITVIEAHLFAKRFDRASRSAFAYAELLEHKPDSRGRAMAAGMRCIGSAIAAKGGDPTALPHLWAEHEANTRLEKPYGTDANGAYHPALCTVLLADLVDKSARAALLLDPGGGFRANLVYDNHEMMLAARKVLGMAVALVATTGARCVPFGNLCASTAMNAEIPEKMVRCESNENVGGLSPLPEVIALRIDAGEWEEARRLLDQARAQHSDAVWQDEYAKVAERLELYERGRAPYDPVRCAKAVDEEAEVAARPFNPYVVPPRFEHSEVFEHGDPKRIVELEKIYRRGGWYWPYTCTSACPDKPKALCDRLRNRYRVTFPSACPYCGLNCWPDGYREQFAAGIGDVALVDQLARRARRQLPIFLDRSIAAAFEMLKAYGSDLDEARWSPSPESREP